MRILKLKEFLNSKQGTVFAKYEPIAFEDMCIFDSRCGDIDFFYANIFCEVDAESSDIAFSLLLSAEIGGKVPLTTNVVSRDGCFEEDQLFAVYEKEDLLNLIEKLNESLRKAY